LPDEDSPQGVFLTVNENVTQFDTGGRTHFPNDLVINYGGITFVDNSYQTTAWPGSLDTIYIVNPTPSPGTNFRAGVQADLTNGVSINSSIGTPSLGTNYSWKFGFNGSLTFPDSTVQSTAWLGTAAAGTLTGTTLNSTVVSSSLTSVGTLGSLTVQGGTGTYYAARFKGSTGGDQFAIGLSSTAGYGAANDILNGAGTAYATYTVSASTITLKTGTSTPATALSIDSSGNATIANNLTVTGTFTGGAPAGSLTGTTLNSTVVSSSLTSVGTLTSLSSGAITTTGTLALNASGGITTNQTTFPLVNTTATTVNFAGAATTVSIGAGTGKVTINSTDATSSTTTGSLVVKGGVGVGGGIYTGGLISANGAISSNSTITATGNLIAGNGILATPTTTGYVYNSVATTVNIGGSAGTINIGYNATTNLSGQLLVSYTGSGSSAGIIVTTSNTVGGLNYADFLKVTNTASGATNGSKTMRLNSTGTLEILNSAYGATVFSVTDTGLISINASSSATDGVAVNNGIAMNANSYIFDDGNYHITTKSGNIWLNSNSGGTVNINTQMPSGVTGGGLVSQGAVKSNAAGAAGTAFIAGAGAISGIALQLDSGTAGTAASMAIRDTSTVTSTMYFDVSTGSTPNGIFRWRSSSSFTELMSLSSTQLTINEAVTMGGSTATAYLSVIGSKTYSVSAYGYLGTGGAGTVGGNSGNVAYGIYCANRIQSGEVDVTSDERAKDIQGTIPLEQALQFVRAVDGILYTWKPGFGDEGLKSGFSAQGVHKAGFDHMVGHIPNENLAGDVDADGWTHPDKFQLTMGYNQAIPYHHEVIKHLLERIEQLEATVAKLAK
jgi:hypothetical protein